MYVKDRVMHEWYCREWYLLGNRDYFTLMLLSLPFHVKWTSLLCIFFDELCHIVIGDHFMMTSWNGIFYALLAICAGNSPVSNEFPTQRPVTRSFDVFIDLRLNKRLSKQSWGWWFETPSRPLWRHRNVLLNDNYTSVVATMIYECHKIASSGPFTDMV